MTRDQSKEVSVAALGVLHSAMLAQQVRQCGAGRQATLRRLPPPAPAV